MESKRIETLLDIIRGDENLKNQLDIFSDVIFLDEPDMSFEDDANDVHTDWSIERMCAFAEDGSGGKFYLLKDGTIGFESSEGQAGRIAENTDDFLRLIVYCPFWMDFCGVRSVSYQKDRKGFFEETEKERTESMTADGMDYYKIQKEAAQKLGLTTPESSFEISEKFYKAVTKEPRFYGICSEDGSDEKWETDNLFV